MTEADRIKAIRQSLPESGLFAEKTWRLSPEPFPIPKADLKFLQRLGPLLQRFIESCNLAYFRSRKGSLPSWVADYLDAGKPEDLLELACSGKTRDDVPKIIRPDLILTETGFALTELDNVPGGVGLTAWLNEVYSQWDSDKRLIGGPTGMLDGFRRVIGDSADIIVSDESGDYRPEMHWVTERLHQLYPEGDWSCLPAEGYTSRGKSVYRFLELFDLDNIPGIDALAEIAAAGEETVSPPFKPFLEEKLWLALFHLRPLRSFWERELRSTGLAKLESIIPYSWVIDPEPLPHHAVLPRLELQSWDELKEMTQKERQLVLKISGFSEQAWGSRSVKIGQDLSQKEWGQAVDHAIDSFPQAPYVMQEFHKGKLVKHPYWDEEEGRMKIMEGRVRLCPYYLPGENGKAALSGILATICPSDKKVLHGMSDAILVPCCLED